jgi:hypothetical protein
MIMFRILSHAREITLPCSWTFSPYFKGQLCDSMRKGSTVVGRGWSRSEVLSKTVKHIRFSFAGTCFYLSMYSTSNLKGPKIQSLIDICSCLTKVTE